MDNSDIYDHVDGHELSTASESNIQGLVTKSHKTDSYVLNYCKAIMGSISPVETSVIYLHTDEGDIDSEPELVIDLSFESYTASECDKKVVDLPYAKDLKLNHFKGAGSEFQLENHDEPRVSNSNLLHDIEEADDSLSDRTCQLNNPGRHIRDERDSFNFEVATSSELNSNPNCEPTIKFVSPLGLCINSNRKYEKLDEFISSQKSLSGFHLQKMKYQKHEQQFPKCSYPLVQLSEDEKEKCVKMGRTGEAVELGKSNLYKRKCSPSTIGKVEERNLGNVPLRETCTQQPDNSEPIVKRVRTLEDGLLHKSKFGETILNGPSATNQFCTGGYTFPFNIETERVINVRTSSHSTPQTIRRLESVKNSEPTVRFVCPPGWLNGNDVVDDSVPLLRTVSTRHPVQVRDDKERVIENLSPARLTYAGISTSLFEPPTGEERNLANVSSGEKCPQRPDVRTLDDVLLHKSKFDETIFNGPSAANNVPTVGCTFSSNIEEERLISVKTSPQLTPRKSHPNRRLESWKSREQTVSRVYPLEWFNGSKKVGDSVALLKTVSTRHPIQVVDGKERVTGCMSRARSRMKSTSVNEKIDESIARRVNGHHTAHVSSRCKCPHQPSNLEPTGKSVDYSQKVTERLAAPGSNGTRLTRTIQNNRQLEPSKNSGSTVRFAYPPECLNGGKKASASNSDSFLKTVSIRHPVQLTDKEQSKGQSICVNGNPDDSLDYLQSQRISLSVSKERSAVSASARTQLTQTVESNRRLVSSTNSEPTVQFVYPPEWLDGNNMEDESVTLLKTVSTRPVVQLADDKERVIENMSPAGFMSKSTCVSEDSDASFDYSQSRCVSPSICKERSAVSASARTQLTQTVESNRRLVSSTNSEPTVRFVYPPEWLDGNNMEDESVTLLKTVSTRPVVQLADDKERVIENMPPAGFMSKSTCVSEDSDESFDYSQSRCVSLPTCKERSAVSASARTQLTQTVESNRRLVSSTNSEPTVRFVYPPEWLDGNNMEDESVTLLKTVSTRPVVQLADDTDRVIENMPPAGFMSKSTCVNEDSDESFDYSQSRCVSLPTCKERSAVSASARTQLTQTVESHRRLVSSTNSEPTVRFVYPEWLDGNNMEDESVTLLKTVSTRPVVQLADDEKRVIENMPPAGFMSKSTCVNEDSDESFDYSQSRCVSPSICKERSAVSASARTQLTQTVESNRRLVSSTNSEPTVRFVYPPEWLDGNNMEDESVTLLKTVSTRPVVQLADDKERVIENMPPAGFMSKSTCVSEDSDESFDYSQSRCVSPPTCKDRSAVSASASDKLTQTIQNGRRLDSLKYSEPTVRFVCPSEWLNGDNKLTVQSNRRVESSTKSNKQTVKFVFPPEWLNRDKVIDSIYPSESVSTRRPHNCHQPPGDFEPVVESLFSSQGKRLFETNFRASISDEVSDKQCTIPSKEKSASSASNICLSGETVCLDKKVKTLNLEQTVKFECPSSWLNEYKDFEDSSPAIQTEAPDSQTCSSLKAEARCMLPFAKDNEDEVLHVEYCDTIAYALDLKAKESSMLNSLPREPLDLVNKIISNCCRQFLLNNSCTSERCTKVHDILLDFDIPGHDFKTSFNVFVSWFFRNSEQPNLKTLLRLLSYLSRDFGDGLLTTILCFSPALMKVKEDFRRPLGIKLIEKLVHQVDLSKNDAIRSIIVFNITHDTKNALITLLLRSLGIYEDEVGCLYESVSCIWHINGNYSFSEDVLFPMLKECLREMPPQFGVAKEKIIAELLKFSRSVLIKHVVVIERILLKYYACNSWASHKMRSVIYHGKIPEREDSTEKKSYQSSRVKSLGPIDHTMEYWDLQEQRIKSFELVMCKMRESADTEEAPVELAAVPNFITEELLDNTDTGDNLKLLENTVSKVDSVECSKYVKRMQKALRFRKYHKLFDIFTSHEVRSSLDSYMNEFCYLLASLNMSELALTIYKFLNLLSESEHSFASVIVEKLTMKINSLVLIFYKNGNFKDALKLLKTLVMGEVNPLGHPPEEIDEPTFEVVCSEIHFQCHCMNEAVRTLFVGDCMNYFTYVGCKMTLSNHFLLLERLVFHMFECFVKRRLPSLASILFKGIYIAQKDLYYPIDISRYYELVLCNSYMSCKASCAPHEGVELFILVESVSSNVKAIHRPTTLRTLVVELVRVKAPDDTLRSILFECFLREVYPAFKIGAITLGTHLLVDEMYIYLFYYFKYFFTQERQAFLQQPCTIKLVETRKPLRRRCTFKELTQVSNEISDARERFKEALRLVVGKLYPTLSIEFPSSCEAFIPTTGIEALAESYS